MTDAVQTYCAASRQLAALQQKSKDDLQDIREAKRAANALLLEIQTEEEVVARLPEGCFSVRVKVNLRRPTQGAEIFQSMEEFWQSGKVQQWKKRLAEDPDLDPVQSLVDTVVADAWPPPVQKRTLDLRRVKESSARVQDLPETPAQTTPLLSSVVEAKRIMSERLAIVREDKKKLQEECKAAEQKIIPDLAQLPEGYIRRVNLRDSAGAEESFYLRLKPPRKKPPKKFSSLKVEKALKIFIEEKVSTPSRQELVDRLASPRFGALMCREIAETLSHVDGAVAGPRVALDRLRPPREE